MKIQSLSGKRAKTVLLLAVLLVSILVLYLFPIKDEKREMAYHQSEWNEYAPEIDKAVLAGSTERKVGLDHVYGGVVSHHIPMTIPKLVEFYERLRKTQTVRNFIIIGPDHTDAGKAPITTSNEGFFTVYGQVRPIDRLVATLEDSKLANIEESPFDKEHSVGSQILVISKIFPEAKVTPIIIRSNTTKEQAEALGKTLVSFLDADTVLIASVDFSHYLATSQATPIDRISADVIRNLDLENLALVKADSDKSVTVFMRAMIDRKAKDTSDFDILNTNDLMQNSDYTTGYIFGFWGINGK